MGEEVQCSVCVTRTIVMFPEGWMVAKSCAEDSKRDTLREGPIEFTCCCVFARDTLTHLCALRRNTLGI